MCPAHRLTVLNEIKRLLGKERLICISTQLIEAGVDISFECVIRALAGLDSILQALGRCNRNGEHPLRYGYVVNVTGENLTKLPDVQRGAEESRRILDEMKADPHAYGGDPLSLEAMSRYYETYFHKSQGKMDFLVNEPKTSIYDLLSVNRLGISACRSRDHKPPALSYAFETAGKSFQAIEKNTAVLVPYGDGHAIITELRDGNVGIKRKQELLRIAGRYSINLFDYQVERLEKEGGVILLEEGVLALTGGYYDLETGFHIDRRLGAEKRVKE